MDRHGGMKKYGREEKYPLVQAVKEEVLPGYEDYLVLFQQRNRKKKNLRQKSKSHIERECKEKGFKEVKILGNRPTVPTQPGQKTARKLKTAGDIPRNANILDKGLETIAKEKLVKQNQMSRAKTAPSARERRRIWNAELVEIKATKGETRVKPPEILTGRYDDDFELDDYSDGDTNSDDLHSSDSENSNEAQRNVKPVLKQPPPHRQLPRESDLFNSSDSVNSEDEEQIEISRKRSAVSDSDSDEDDIEIDAAKFSKNSMNSPKTVQKRDKLKGQAPGSDSEDFGEKLMLSLKELKTLRQSLVKNPIIRQSLKQSLVKDNSSGDDDFILDSTILEVDKEIPSGDSTSPEESPYKKINLKNTGMKAKDTVAPEFGSGMSGNRRIEKNLSAARGKDLNDVKMRPSSGEQPRNPPRYLPRSQSAKLMCPEKPLKNAMRPLSANWTSDTVWSDPDTEASAVMATLKEENKKVSQFSKNDTSLKTPRPLPTPRSASQPSHDESETLPKSHQQGHTESSSVNKSQGEPLTPRNKIENIMEKVLRMSPRHQRQLVSMLHEIEKSFLTESMDNPDTVGHSKPRTSSDGPTKAAQRSLAKKPSEPSKDDGSVELRIEVLSNWGHAMRLGLTEIQIYDDKQVMVPISASDVTVHGAEDCKGTLDVLFDGIFKTNRERDMWSCRYHSRRPVEFIINVRNPQPESKQNFSLSQMKIWNYNKSVMELDKGIKDIKVFAAGELVFRGSVEKGCGNQIIDYCHQIPLNPPLSSRESSPVKDENLEEKDMSQKINSYVQKNKIERDISFKETKEISDKKASKNSQRNDSVVTNSSQNNNSVVSLTNSRALVSSRGERSTTPVSIFTNKKSPREGMSLNHRIISPQPSSDRKKTIRSMSSQSSTSSGGESQPNSRPSSGVMTPMDREKIARSESRTVSHPTAGRQLPKLVKVSDSISDNEDSPNDVTKSKDILPAKHEGRKTPKKSKRMAARLDGHSSVEVDSSKSVGESSENSPAMPQRKTDEKLSRKPLVQKSLEDKVKNVEATTNNTVKQNLNELGSISKKLESESELKDTLKAASNTTSFASIASSQDDTPMLQKLKNMNKKDNRPKDIPNWQKQENTSVPLEAAGKNQELSVEETVQSDVLKAPPTQDEINMLIAEELSKIPELQEISPPTQPEKGISEGDTTPMQKSKSKGRENPMLSLEESWGSLSQFNKSQRGRLSIDMDDDVLDEYINKAAELADLTNEPIAEESCATDTTEQQQTNINVDSDEDTFVIPELPYGKEMVINIHSTWGDKHYVGLTGIEVFSATGEKVVISRIQADPSDINILPEYDKDPRVVKNLLDGCNRTRDDVHMWLTPFTPGNDHWVFCTFDKPCKVALIRIWNYNKSRIHSYRGAKDVIITLDSTVIFNGEIARACGGIEGGTEAFGDTILFTTDEGILDAVSQNDEAYEGEVLSDEELFDVERPSTADAGNNKERPLTRAVGNMKQLERELTVEYEGNMMVYKGKSVQLNFVATWGDQHYLGLTGIEIVGKEGEALPVSMNMLSAKPQDVRHLPGHEQDDRTLDKVIDGNNVTMSDEHMWLIPFTDSQNHILTIDFGQNVLMAGIRIWNYNKSKEDTCRGAKVVHVTIDGKTVSPPEGFLVRKGPGNCHFDFAQEISLTPQSWNPHAGMLSALSQNVGTDESQNYDFIQMPCGFIYQLQLFNTWGDAYYVGLNGVELYDTSLEKIQLTESNISAFPDSINVLDKIQNDVRTPDKLIDGVNDTMDGGHMWLAPILPNILNRVYVIFDQPTTISMIKIWNYSKTTNRGTKDFALLVDDLLVYNGILQAATQVTTCSSPQPYHTILFTNNEDILKKEKNTIINHQARDQDVQMTNDKKIVNHYNDPKKVQSGKPVDQNLRPTTSVIHSKVKTKR